MAPWVNSEIPSPPVATLKRYIFFPRFRIPFAMAPETNASVTTPLLRPSLKNLKFPKFHYKIIYTWIHEQNQIIIEFKVACHNFRNVSSVRWLLTITIFASPLTPKVINENNIAVGHLHRVWIRMRKAHTSGKNRDHSKGELFVHFFVRSVKGTKNLCVSLDMTIYIKVLKISMLLK